MFWSIFLHKRAILISFRQFCNSSVKPLQFVAVLDIRKGKTGEVCLSLPLRSFTSQVSQSSVAAQQMGSCCCVRNQEGLRVRKTVWQEEDQTEWEEVERGGQMQWQLGAVQSCSFYFTKHTYWKTEKLHTRLYFLCACGDRRICVASKTMKAWWHSGLWFRQPWHWGGLEKTCFDVRCSCPLWYLEEERVFPNVFDLY